MEGEGSGSDFKEGEGSRKEKGGRIYRGITLTQTAYKVYAAVLAEKLKEEIEGRVLLPPSQSGFRRGMSTIYMFYRPYICFKLLNK